MLTAAHYDERYLAEILALSVCLDWAKLNVDFAENVDLKLRDLSRKWHVRAFVAEAEIRQKAPRGSRNLHAASFIDPIRSVLSARLKQMSLGIGGDFQISLEFETNSRLFARVSGTYDRDYRISVGLSLIVPLFLGAITLSQPGSNASAHLPNPYQSKFGDGAAEVYNAQAPLLQALEVSAFRHLLPQDNWRRLLAYEVFAKAIEFALLHEFGHAIRGHLEFLTKYGMPADRIEDNGLPEGISPLTHQLLEAQADDTASMILVRKWKNLSASHPFDDGPLMLSRYGFCVTRPDHAHLIHAYAVTLLFFVLDAADRGAKLIGGAGDARARSHPTPAYRVWRFHKWMDYWAVSPQSWLTCIEHVRDDLAEDGFPHADSIFCEQLVLENLVSYDSALAAHAKADAQGRVLMKHEAAFASMIRPDKSMGPPTFWGEKKVSLIERTTRLFARNFGRK